MYDGTISLCMHNYLSAILVGLRLCMQIYLSIFLGGSTICMSNREFRFCATSILTWDVLHNYVSCGPFGRYQSIIEG